MGDRAASTAADKYHPTNVARQFRDRRAASWRLPPLDCGVRDPWQPWRPEKLSDKQVAGAVDAAGHLLDLGYPPLFDVDILRAMWRAGHHQLAAECFSYAHREAA